MLVIKERNRRPRSDMGVTRRRPTRDKPVSKNGSNITDKRISVCVPCRKGIFEGQERVWTSNGLVHKGC